MGDTPTRRSWVKWLGRVALVVLGGVGSLAIGVLTNVVSWQLTDGQRIIAPETTTVECERTTPVFAVEGEEQLDVAFQDRTTGCWRQLIDSARPGDTFSMRITYQNNTAVQQDGVSVRAILPVGFEFVDGSTVIANATTEGVYKGTKDGVATVGYNAGSYAPRGNVFIKFEVRMTEALAPLCGVQAWSPTAKVTSDHSPDGLTSAGAVVTVRPACE